MKMISIFALVFLIMFQCQASAKNSKEDALKEKLKELSYGGQLDTAKEFMGEETKRTSPGKPDEGWDMTSMMLSMFWGSVGTGYFIYGRKQARGVFLLCGVGLCVFPMLVTSMTASIILGLVMCIAPFKIDI